MRRRDPNVAEPRYRYSHGRLSLDVNKLDLQTHLSVLHVTLNWQQVALGNIRTELHTIRALMVGPYGGTTLVADSKSSY